MDTARIMRSFLQYLPDFLRKKISSKSMTNLSQENFIYDSDGYILFIQPTQSNLSLFNISSDSLIFNEYEDLHLKTKTIKHWNSSIDIYFDIKKSVYCSTMILSEDIFSTKTNTLQRWKRLELLNTYA